MYGPSVSCQFEKTLLSDFLRIVRISQDTDANTPNQPRVTGRQFLKGFGVPSRNILRQKSLIIHCPNLRPFLRAPRQKKDTVDPNFMRKIQKTNSISGLGRWLDLVFWPGPLPNVIFLRRIGLGLWSHPSPSVQRVTAPFGSRD